MGFLGSIAGGLFGIGSPVIQNSQNRQNVRETNQMNYKINQMNNQFNERMAMQQRDFQENMWNKENAYNTASAQRQRLEEAGLNPYMMMNGGSAGTAQSVGTGASASSVGSAVMQPFQADYSGVQQAIGSVFQSQVQQAQVSQLQGQKNLADAQAMQALSNVDWSKMTKETREYLKATGLARAQLGYSKEMQEQSSELIPNVSPDAFAVAPEFDCTEELRVEVDDTDETRPVRYTSDVRLILHTKDLASRAGLAIASKFGQGKQSASQIQQIMDKMSDDDLLLTVRSRHIHSPSEIIAWSKELSSYAERLESQAQELIEVEASKQETAKQEAEKASAAPAGSVSSE